LHALVADAHKFGVHVDESPQRVAAAMNASATPASIALIAAPTSRLYAAFVLGAPRFKGAVSFHATPSAMDVRSLASSLGLRAPTCAGETPSLLVRRPGSTNLELVCLSAALRSKFPLQAVAAVLKGSTLPLGANAAPVIKALCAAAPEAAPCLISCTPRPEREAGVAASMRIVLSDAVEDESLQSLCGTRGPSFYVAAGEVWGAAGNGGGRAALSLPTPYKPPTILGISVTRDRIQLAVVLAAVLIGMVLVRLLLSCCDRNSKHVVLETLVVGIMLYSGVDSIVRKALSGGF
jgi:hypothetical protein